MEYTAQLFCCGGTDLQAVEEEITESGMSGHAVYRCKTCGSQFRMIVFIQSMVPQCDSFTPEGARKRSSDAMFQEHGL